MSSKEPKKNQHRIPYEDLDSESAISSWTLPSMDSQGRIIQSAQKESQQKKPSKEKIEKVPLVNKPKQLTAEQLQQITEEAKQEGYLAGYEEGKQKGLQDGLAQGQRDGQTKAYKQTKQKLENESLRLRTIADGLLAPMQEQDLTLENLIVEMAVQFSRGILRQELSFNPAHLYQIVNTALNALPVGAKNINVYLNAEDIKLLEQVLPSQQRTWSVREDNQLASGGCRVETAESLVDYTLDTRLANYITDAFKKGQVDEAQQPEIENFRDASFDQTGLEKPTLEKQAVKEQSLSDHHLEGQANEQQAGNQNSN